MNVQFRDAERPFQVLINICDIGLVDGELIEREGVQGFDRLLPLFLTFLFRLLLFLTELREVHVQNGTVDLHVADQHSGKDAAPVDSRICTPNGGNWRVRMFLLRYRHVAQRYREAQRMK